jgi:hypothetical protein
MTAFNSKLEVHKITLDSEKSNPSFLKLFTSRIDEDDRIVFLDIVGKFFKAIDLNDFHANQKKKKAITAYDTQKTEESEPSIVPYPERFIIQGFIEGGKFGKKRIKSALGEKNIKQELGIKTLILDKYYFMLYAPLDSKIGILIIHSYSTDSITDVFIDFLKDFFSNKERGYKKPKSERYFPKAIAEEFEKNSSIRKFSYSTRMIVDTLDDEPIKVSKKEFNIKIEAVAEKNINRSELEKWLRTLQNSVLSIGKGKKAFKDFEKEKVSLQNDITKKETPFEIQKDFKIKPVIYLDSTKVKMNEEGIPDFNSLKNFCFTLMEDIKREIYPINAIRER